MRLKTRGTMAELVAVKQNFRKIIKEWLKCQKFSFYVFANNCMSKNNYSEILHGNMIDHQIISNDIKAHIC